MDSIRIALMVADIVVQCSAIVLMISVYLICSTSVGPALKRGFFRWLLSHDDNVAIIEEICGKVFRADVGSTWSKPALATQAKRVTKVRAA